MHIDPDIRALVEAGRLDEVEDRWLEHLEGAPHDLPFFLGVVRALRHASQDERATFLLQLLADAHRERGDLQAELELLEAAVGLWPESPVLRQALIDCLRQAHAGRPSVEICLQHFKVAEARDPLPALVQVRAWLRFDAGTSVWLPGRGVGRVAEINLALAVLRVDFEAGTRVSFRLGEAERLLVLLEPGHFLLDRSDRPAAMQELAAADPGEILHRVFTSLGRSSMTLAELREMLAGVVPEEGWSAWWKAARADPRLAVGGGARATLAWSESGAAAEAALGAQFEAACARDRLEMARQHAARSPELAAILARGLAAMAREQRDADPGLALEAALLLEKLPGAPRADPGLEPAAFLEVADPVPVVAGVADRGLRERALALLRARRADWPALYARLLRAETDARTLALLSDAVQEVDPGLVASVVEDVLARPHLAPRFFLWLCREPRRRDDIERRDAWALLRRLLDAHSEEAFRGLRLPLRELFAGGGLGEQLAARLSLEQAEQLLVLLERDIGLEEHRREGLRQVVRRRFPELREMQEEVLYSTPEALERLRAEFERIVRVDIPHNAEEIHRAAAHGDLSENFEYKAARDRHEMLSSRAKRLHDELRRARALDPAHIDTSVVRVGTRVVLESARDGGGDRRTLTILGPWDSDPAAGVLSYLAPAVQPLLGKRPGDEVRLGDGAFVVASIDTWRPPVT